MKEIWKPVYGFESTHKVSNLGRVKSLARTVVIVENRKPFHKKERILKPTLKYGYYKLVLTDGNIKKGVNVHRLIAQAFIPNPNNHPYINHKNCIKTDNRIENLEWCTPKQNVHHAMTMGVFTGAPLKNKNAGVTEVLNLNTGIFYESMKDAAESIGMSRSYFTNHFKDRGFIKTSPRSREIKSISYGKL